MEGKGTWVGEEDPVPSLPPGLAPPPGPGTQVGHCPRGHMGTLFTNYTLGMGSSWLSLWGPGCSVASLTCRVLRF